VSEDVRVASASPDHSHDIYTVANIITVLRLILVPLFFSVMLTGRNDALAFVLFVTAASTDWLDGRIARRTGTVTAIGKAIDPLVDRLLLAAGVIGLYLDDRLPAWIMVVLVMRDVYLLYGAWRLEHHHLRMPVTFAGKTATALLLGGFSLMILDWPMVTLAGSAVLAGLLIVYTGIAFSLATAVHYTVLARRMVLALDGSHS